MDPPWIDGPDWYQDKHNEEAMTKLAELRRQLNNNFLLGRKTSLALIDVAEAAVSAYYAGTLCERGDTAAGRVGCRCEPCLKRLELEATLARLGGER